MGCTDLIISTSGLLGHHISHLILCDLSGLEEAQAGLGGHQNSEGDIQYGRMQDSRGPVGPPSPANFKAAAEALYYEEDEAADEEADKEDEDDQDFSRTGMHAEL